MLLLLISLIYFTTAQNTQPVADPKEYRDYAYKFDSNENSLSVAGAKVELTQNGDFSGTGKVDIGGFKFVAGGANQQVAMGFTALSGSASVDWAPTPEGGKVLFSITGAWVEMILGFSQIFLYQEKNQQPGFQYSLGNNVWDCTTDNGLDCIQAWSVIDIQKDLTYTNLKNNIKTESCPQDPAYNENCTVWIISTVGSYLGNSVFELSLKVANQKVFYGPAKSLIGPDYGKVDWTIRYPYVAKNQDKTKANVGLVGFAAGKAGTAGVIGGTYQGKSSLVFQGDNDKAAVLAWDGTATLNTDKVSPIFVNGISGASIVNYDCSQCDPISNVVITGWKLGAAYASFGGWTTELVILSWDGVAADIIEYDPTIGMAATSDIEASSTFLMPSLFTLVFCINFLFHHLF